MHPALKAGKLGHSGHGAACPDHDPPWRSKAERYQPFPDDLVGGEPRPRLIALEFRSRLAGIFAATIQNPADSRLKSKTLWGFQWERGRAGGEAGGAHSPRPNAATSSWIG
jgi:hypothetical protein